MTITLVDTSISNSEATIGVVGYPTSPGSNGAYTVKADWSHAEGYNTVALSQYSHAEGSNTIALGEYQHVQGQWNLPNSGQSAFIIGNGTSNTSRSNLLYASGSEVHVTGSLKVSGSTYLKGSFSSLITIIYLID